MNTKNTKKIASLLALTIVALFTMALPLTYAQDATPPAPAASTETPAPTTEPQIIPIEEQQQIPFYIPETYTRATILSIQPENDALRLTLKILEGEEKDKVVRIQYGGFFTIQGNPLLQPGQEVVVGKAATSGQPAAADISAEYTIVDQYRLPSLIIMVVIFLALAIFFGRKKGVTSIIGLILTIAVLLYGIVPAIMAGHNPVLVSFIGATVIAIISLYISHGFSKRTTIALISLLITLILATGLSLLFVSISHLTGAASENAYFLQFGSLKNISLSGLLLGGIIIGALGVLDDITTSQAAAVEEIHKANRKLTLPQLYQRGLSVGREHIASLVNTLFLAYAGASFPLLLLLTDNPQQPLWLTLNQEFMVEEIVRTLVGSSALVLAVPITTFLAARAFTRHHHHDKTHLC